MDKIYQIYDFTQDSFIHGTIEKFEYDLNAKEFRVIFSYLNLKQGGCLYDCTITITDWWDFEVYEYDKQKRVRQFDLKEIPEIDRIIKLTYENNELILTDFGMRNNTAIDYKFTKPKIHITGQYDPD